MWLSWRCSRYDPVFPAPWLSSAPSREDAPWLQEGGAATVGLAEHLDLTEVALLLWSLIFSLLSAALSPHLACVGSYHRIFPFQQHLQQEPYIYYPKLLLPPNLYTRGWWGWAPTPGMVVERAGCSLELSGRARSPGLFNPAGLCC